MGEQQALAIDRVLVKPATGERFIATSRADWTARFAEWQQAIRTMRSRLERDPVLRVLTHGAWGHCGHNDCGYTCQHATRADRWAFYRRAERAGYAAIPPCPMPEGHCMFENPAGYGCQET